MFGGSAKSAIYALYCRWENKNKKGRSTTKELRDSYFGQLSEDEVFNCSKKFTLRIMLQILGVQTLPAL